MYNIHTYVYYCILHTILYIYMCMYIYIYYKLGLYVCTIKLDGAFGQVVRMA